MSPLKPAPVQLPLGWLAPGVVLMSLFINYNIASVDRLKLDQFVPVAIGANRVASYAPDALALAFPAANPQLFDQVLQDQSSEPNGRQLETPSTSPTSAAPSPTATLGATATPPVAQPTQGGGNTGGGLLPPLQVTVPAVLPTQIVPVLETLIPDPIEDILQPIVTQLPICIPLPPLIRCP